MPNKASPLDIFDKSIKTGVFPDELKIAIVIPVFKARRFKRDFKPP